LAGSVATAQLPNPFGPPIDAATAKKVAAAAIAVTILPPRGPSTEGFVGSFFGWSHTDYVPRDPSGDAIHAAASTLRWRFVESSLAESIVTVARLPGALRSTDGAITVVYAPTITRDSARIWLAAASSELALVPQAGVRGLPVVVALARWLPARSTASREQRLLSGQTFLGLQGVAGTSGACVVVLNLGHPHPEWYVRELMAHDASGRPLGRFLDACALYGRFGVPGRGVSAWADRGPEWYWGGYDQLSRRMQDARRRLRPDTVTAEWVYSAFWRGEVQWAPLACLRGGEAVCVRIAGLEPSVRGFWWYDRLTRSQLFAWLLVNRKPSEFAAFWRSDLPPARALQEAYGEPAGKLVRSAFAHWTVAPDIGGPRAGARIVLAGFAWGAVALGLALTVGRRWSAEI
jgi:hypothetical protein